MNLTTVPTLQKIVLLKLATTVYSVADIKSWIRDHARILYRCRRRRIKKIISSIKLPKTLRARLVSIMKPVVIEISSWILYIRHIHEEVAKCLGLNCSCLDEVDLLENVRWKTVGLLDKHVITLELIRNELLDLNFRFVLACSCCSEVDILLLWLQISSDGRRRFSCFRFLPVVRYWIDRLETAGRHNYKCIPNPKFPYEFQFEYSYFYLDTLYAFYNKLPYEVQNYLFGIYGRSLKDLKRRIFDEIRNNEHLKRVTIGLVNVDSIAALKYFLHKFERIRRRKLLEEVARNHFISCELLMFCLSQMSTDQVKELLRSGHGSRVLSCFANSPWQENLWKFIDEYWDDLTTTNLSELGNYIVKFKLKGKWQDFDYKSARLELNLRYHQKRRDHLGEM